MAHARIEPVVAECRLFYEDAPEPDAAYIGSLLIRYRALEPGAVDICMFTATQKLNKEVLRALLDGLLAAGIHTIYAHRRLEHRFPGAVLLPCGSIWRTDLVALEKRWSRRQ